MKVKEPKIIQVMTKGKSPSKRNPHGSPSVPTEYKIVFMPPSETLIKGGVMIFNKDNPVPSVFEYGSTCEWGSYNLSYLGELIDVTEKVAIIQPQYSGITKRLSLREFCFRNFGFNLEKIIEYNNMISQNI